MQEKLDKKTRELVMLGAAVGANCDTCWVYHYQEAKKAGSTHEEMLAVTEAAEEVRAFVIDRIGQRVKEVREAGGLTQCVSSCRGK